MRTVLLSIAPALLLAGCGGPEPSSNTAAAANVTAPAGDAEKSPSAQIDRSHRGEAPPAIAFRLPDGATRTIGDFGGTPVLVNLWATWCAPCKAEMPTLDALAVREEGRLTVLTVSQDLQGATAVQPYFATSGFKALQPWLDPDVRFSTAFAATLPMTILYGADGRERWRATGGMDWAGKEAAELIAEAR